MPELDRPSKDRRALRWVLIVLCAIAVPLTYSRDVQLVWQALLPIPLLLMSANAVARIQVISVLGLLLLGGAVTTYRVGMAVPDWPGTFAQNMWTYPLSEMLEQGYGVTLEHTHRLWASAVGLIAICQVCAAHIGRERRAVLGLSWAALFAIAGQGLLGGTRVLENSQHLAFLHGALAQLVFALVVTSAVVSGRRWRAAPRVVCDVTTALRKSALLAVLVVYAQIVLGAVTRHSGQHLPLGLHITLAIGALVVVAVLIGRLGAAYREGRDNGYGSPALLGLRRWTAVSLHSQLLLGVLVTASIFMWSGGFESEVSVGEAVFASLHVAVGAVLFSSCVAALLWSWHALVPPPRGAARLL